MNLTVEDDSMIKLLNGFPDNVVAAEAIGEVEDDDYSDVLVPAVEAASAKYDKIRFLYVFGADFDKIEGEAMWDDAKVGMKHFFAFERMAVVSDKSWMRGAIKTFGFLIPGKARTFGLGEVEEAKAWIVADD